MIIVRNQRRMRMKIIRRMTRWIQIKMCTTRLEDITLEIYDGQFIHISGILLFIRLLFKLSKLII